SPHLKRCRLDLFSHFLPLALHFTESIKSYTDSFYADTSQSKGAGDSNDADNALDKINRFFWCGRDNLNILFAVALYPIGICVGVAGGNRSRGLRKVMPCCGVGMCGIGGFLISLPAWGGLLLKTTKTDPCGGNNSYGYNLSLHADKVYHKKFLTRFTFCNT